MITCDTCGNPCTPTSPITTGYGVFDNPDGTKTRCCYACCAKWDKANMIETGHAVLYLTIEGTDKVRRGEYRRAKVSNWPGSLEFQVYGVSVGCHNIARVRYDVSFRGPDGALWAGTQYGDNTQVCHCRRTKRVI